MPDIQIRWMAPKELGRLADIDRSERVRLGYRMEEGQLLAEEVDWHVPNFTRQAFLAILASNPNPGEYQRLSYPGTTRIPRVFLVQPSGR